MRQRLLLELPENQVAGPFGISFDANDPSTIVIFSVLNIIIHSVWPIPITTIFWVAAVLMYGPIYGFLLTLLTSALGCYLALVVTRCFRPWVLRLLGEHQAVWHALDYAIVRERWKIPLLVRSTPVMPVVLTNFLLALTSIDTWTYTWTVTVGMIPSGLPYAYGAVVGEAVLKEFPPKDPLLLLLSLIGLVATVLAVYKVGSIATHELSKAGVESPMTRNGSSTTTSFGSSSNGGSSTSLSSAPVPAPSRSEDAGWRWWKRKEVVLV